MRAAAPAIALLAACRSLPAPPDGIPPPAPVRAADPADELDDDDDPPAVSWADLRAEIERTICIRTLEVPDREPVDAPSYGKREACDLPEATQPIERIVDAAFAEARPVLISLRKERDAAFEAVRAEPADARTANVKKAYLTEAFLGVLLPRLATALDDEGLRCEGCPTAVHPPRREVDWATFEPYLLAHVWPDAVVTPPKSNKAEPEISVHICGGLNGVERLSDPDPQLVQAGYLAAFHNRDTIASVLATVIGAIKEGGELRRFRNDDARTEYLRRVVPERVAADSSVRPAACEALERFEVDTGVVVTDCG